MSIQQAVVTNVACGANCSSHGAITVTYTVGATGFDTNGRKLVRVGDTGTPSCNISQIATATTGSGFVDISGLPVHRITDSGSTPHGTYIITSVPVDTIFCG